jgi:hypothetical protein
VAARIRENQPDWVDYMYVLEARTREKHPSIIYKNRTQLAIYRNARQTERGKRVRCIYRRPDRQGDKERKDMSNERYVVGRGRID